MSELEKKRDSQADADREHRKRDDANDAKDKKKEPEPEIETSMLMPWDADVDGFFRRVDLYIRDLGFSMGHTEFRSLVVQYRELSAMGRRSVGTRLQQRGLDALFRAIHAGDYDMYQHTWQEDAPAFQRKERAGKLDPEG